MKIFLDSNSLFLRKREIDNRLVKSVNTYWLFYKELKPDFLLNIAERNKVFIGLGEQSNTIMLSRLDEYQRAFRRMNLIGLRNNIIQTLDKNANGNKIYYDLSRFESNSIDELIRVSRNSNAFIFSPNNLDNNTLWLEHILKQDSATDVFTNYLNLLEDKIKLIILIGYSHRRENILMFLTRKENLIFDNSLVDDDLVYSVFENTHIFNPFYF